MKKRYFFALLAAIFSLSACEKGMQGEVVGVYNKQFNNRAIPLGMVFIPPGKALIGMSDEDITFSQNLPSKMASFTAFYMDQTETSNAKYRQFVNWVRDSVAVKQVLGESGAPTLFEKPSDPKITGPKNIKWSLLRQNGAILWRKGSPYKEKLKQMFYQGEDVLFGRNEIDVRKLKYSYGYLDNNLAANSAKDPTKSRKDFIISFTDSPSPNKANQFPSINVYPDTLIWIKDFSYTQNDPQVLAYFNHAAYDNYPVVGVSWEQAKAYCNWRSKIFKPVAVARNESEYARLPYNLPTEMEFEYAARGGKNAAKYPWGGPYIRNTKACLLANFKVGRGNYGDDGGTYTVSVDSYFPNDFGLYNMAGNVAEWTSTAYNKSATPLLLDINPNYTYLAQKGDSKFLKRKVVKGGSWKDMSFFLQNSVSTYEYQDQPRSFIGFRCVTPFPGNNLN
ncbi:MAG: SUMF1/EgtB/PvdO family nonheme iron enzyme [Sphingobacteriaceae bacterium]|nr:SUMF1/EgtB/PvdO family nonheme iron enzyme [Sphingobacteriaceae bacterium]